MKNAKTLLAAGLIGLSPVAEASSLQKNLEDKKGNLIEVLDNSSKQVSEETISREDANKTTQDPEKSLANPRSIYSGLHGKKSIDKETAEKLSNTNSDCLDLSGLTSLDKEIAEILSKFKGNELYLDGIKSIDKETAEALFGFKGTIYIFGKKLKSE